MARDKTYSNPTGLRDIVDYMNVQLCRLTIGNGMAWIARSLLSQQILELRRKLSRDGASFSICEYDEVAGIVVLG